MEILTCIRGTTKMYFTYDYRYYYTKHTLDSLEDTGLHTHTGLEMIWHFV